MPKQKYEHFARLLSAHMKDKGVTGYRLDEDTPLRASNLSKILNGERLPSDDILQILAGYAPLEITMDELIAWKLADLLAQYPKTIAENAMIEAYQEAKKQKGLT